MGGPQGDGCGVAGDGETLNEDAPSRHRVRRHEVDLVQPPARVLVIGIVGQGGGGQQDHDQQAQGRHRQEAVPRLLSSATLSLWFGRICSAVPVAALAEPAVGPEGGARLLAGSLDRLAQTASRLLGQQPQGVGL